MNQGIQLSVAMIVRDEAEGIAGAIESARKLRAVDEVVVVDTGSRDRTREIARGLGARVFEEAWTGDYAHHRNAAMARCRNDWVFFVDGDEELVDAGDIDEVLQRPEIDGVALTMHCVARSRFEEESVMVRIFDRRRGRWEHAIHEQLVGLEAVALARGLMRARYDEGFEAASRSRLERLSKEEPEHPGESHYPYFIAKTLRSLQDFESLESWARRYLNLETGEAREAEVWVWLVEAAMAAGNLDEAKLRCARGMQRHATYPDLLHMAVTLSIHAWWDACAKPDPRYLCVARRSVGYVEGLGEAARLLGLPMEMESRPGERTRIRSSKVPR